MAVTIINPHLFSAPSDPFAAAVLARNPQGYWRMGETAGTTMADASGFARDGVYQTVTLGVAGLLSGSSDKAMQTDGGSGHNARVTEAEWMNVTTCTFLILFKTIGNPFLMTRWDAGSLSQAQAALDLSGGKARFYANIAGTTRIASTVANLNDNVRHLAIGRYTGSAVSISIDGTTVGSTAATGALNSFTGGLGMLFGNRESSAGQVGASATVLDEAAFFNYDLSDADVTALWAAA